MKEKQADSKDLMELLQFFQPRIKMSTFKSTSKVFVNLDLLSTTSQIAAASWVFWIY